MRLPPRAWPFSTALGSSRFALILSLSGALYSRAQETNFVSPLLGFSQQSSVAERALETKFDAALQKEDLRQWMKRMTAHPHHVGSPYGKEVAEFIRSQFEAWGYETKIEQFDVLFPTPRNRLVEMTVPEPFTARLQEPALPQDSTSDLTQEQLPTYNAYSIDGDVTAELVYVNTGVPKDYEVLAERGISVRGKIVIARYGGSWRGIKPKVAAEHGAIGCLIYSDPREEGYFDGDVYPQGAWRNQDGVQRGSVADIPVFPGDPLTPGVGATKNAERLPLKQAPTLTKIPVLPLSSADALPLLRRLTGPVAPESWRGALPIIYHLGPGPAKVHLKVEFDWRTVPAYDVIARLSGSDRADQWIIRGNHHDAWVCGADDPISGTVVLLEEAKAIGLLAKNGWHPKRTIIFAAWDAEEPGLIGSTEWVETHAEELKQHAAVYVNGDSNARGFLNVSGSHTLQKLINEVAQDVIDPEKKVSVSERARARLMANGSPEERRQLREQNEFRVRALGSGSDYTPFLQHLGIASLDIRYGGEGEGGSYHSIYDSYDYYTRFIDPAFDYGVALAQTAGRTVLRMANADLLPFEFVQFADTVARYAAEVSKLADDMREESKDFNRLLSDKTLELAADPTQPLVLPAAKSAVPHFDFAPLQNAIERLHESATRFQQHLQDTTTGSRGLSSEVARNLDGILMKMEQVLTAEDGLPRRSWYKHLIYAPGLYTGYGVKTMPGIREAIEQRQWDEVNDQIERVATVLDRYADELEHARETVP
jgi:N-acetylated-alpha-linked acidic dipeptidase